MNLTNHFLIAMPGMEDPVFSRSLMYVCEHHDQGAIGIVVNRPIGLSLAGMFEEIGIHSPGSDYDSMPIYFGGPVEMERGFVLHQPLGKWQATVPVNSMMGLTSSRDILASLGQSEGPAQILIALGYAGWAPGQLENELSQNAWLTVEATNHILFDLPPEERLTAALQLLGVNAENLSKTAGHA